MSQHRGISFVPDGCEHVFPCAGEIVLGQFYKQVRAVIRERGISADLFLKPIVQHIFGGQFEFKLFIYNGGQQLFEAAAEEVRRVFRITGLDVGGTVGPLQAEGFKTPYDAQAFLQGGCSVVYSPQDMGMHVHAVREEAGGRMPGGKQVAEHGFTGGVPQGGGLVFPGGFSAGAIAVPVTVVVTVIAVA